LKESHHDETEGQISHFVSICELPLLDQESCPLCSAEFTSDKAWTSHVSRHLRDLSLFGVPRYETDEEERGDISEEEDNLLKINCRLKKVRERFKQILDRVEKANGLAATENPLVPHPMPQVTANEINTQKALTSAQKNNPKEKEDEDQISNSSSCSHSVTPDVDLSLIVSQNTLEMTNPRGLDSGNTPGLTAHELLSRRIS
jgi:hypothetical protein